MYTVIRSAAFFVATVALLSLFSNFANAGDSAAPAEYQVTAFLHATVIPMDRERELVDQTVIVADGKIVAIGPASKIKVPAKAVRIDATGRFLIPALCDMHVHLLGESWNMMLPPELQLHGKDVPSERFLFPFIANGVTTVQDLFGTPDEIPLRQQINNGEILGPRLILAKAIDGPKKGWPPPLTTWVANPDEAAKAVRDAKASGYDKIKVYSFLDKDSYDAIIATAKELKLDVIGHIPNAVSVEYTLDAGQKMFAHSEEVAKHADGDYSANSIDRFAEVMAKHGVWLTPTLVTSDNLIELFANSAAVLGKPEASYYKHPMQQGTWNFMTEKLYLPIPAAAREKIRLDFEKFQRPLTKAFFDRGGKLLAGSDTILPGLVPGFSLHRELKELVDVGLTPYQALRTSTTAPFEYLGEIDKAGIIEVGKLSDLVLLDADPLKDISGVSKVSGVLMRGRWIGAEEIKKKMAEIAAH
jgi:imidazolonepropionase-like amidohydrolase